MIQLHIKVMTKGPRSRWRALDVFYGAVALVKRANYCSLWEHIFKRPRLYKMIEVSFLPLVVTSIHSVTMDSQRDTRSIKKLLTKLKTPEGRKLQTKLLHLADKVGSNELTELSAFLNSARAKSRRSTRRAIALAAILTGLYYSFHICRKRWDYTRLERNCRIMGGEAGFPEFVRANKVKQDILSGTGAQPETGYKLWD